MGATRSREVRTSFKIKTSGMNAVLAELEAATNIEPICEEALYMGANMLADYMRSQLLSLKTTEENYRSDRRYCYKKEKELLLNEMGYTPVSFWAENYNVKIGFDGYGYPTPKYPNGIPTQMLANTVNRGNSFMIPQPFITRTLRKGRKDVIEALKQFFDRELARVTRSKAA